MLKKTFVVGAIVTLIIVAGCQSAPPPVEPPPPPPPPALSTQSKTQETVTVPEDSPDELESNLNNALSELNLVD